MLKIFRKYFSENNLSLFSSKKDKISSGKFSSFLNAHFPILRIPDLLQFSHLELEDPKIIENKLLERFYNGSIQKFITEESVLILTQLFLQKIFVRPELLQEISNFVINNDQLLTHSNHKSLCKMFKVLSQNFMLNLKAANYEHYHFNKCTFLQNFEIKNSPFLIKFDELSIMSLCDSQNKLKIDVYFYDPEKLSEIQALSSFLIKNSKNIDAFYTDLSPFQIDNHSFEKLTPQNLKEYAFYLKDNNYLFDQKKDLVMNDKNGKIDPINTFISYVTLTKKFEVNFLGPKSEELENLKQFKKNYVSESFEQINHAHDFAKLLFEKDNKNNKKINRKNKLNEKSDLIKNERISDLVRGFIFDSHLLESFIGKEFELFAQKFETEIETKKIENKENTIFLFLNAKYKRIYTKNILKYVGNNLPKLDIKSNENESNINSFLKIRNFLENKDSGEFLKLLK